jgi:Ca2+-binding RTX toxin-like protein
VAPDGTARSVPRPIGSHTSRLLTGLVVAYTDRAIDDRPIANSRTPQTVATDEKFGEGTMTKTNMTRRVGRGALIGTTLIAPVLAAATVATADGQGQAVATCQGRVPTIVVPPGNTDDVLGTPGPDVILGSTGADRIFARGGSDRVCGRGGNDQLFGGAGIDLLQGDAGDDLIQGGQEGDGLRGGTGKDEIYGDDGADVLTGDDGADLLLDGNGQDFVAGGNGADRIVSRGDSGFTFDRLFGGPDDDKIVIEGTGVKITHGDAGDDLLIGSPVRDHLHGDAGDDRLLGKAGNDSLDCGAGTDVADGGSGIDSANNGQCETLINVP